MNAAAASSPRRRDTGTVRAIETTLLVIVGVILAVATVNDVGRQVQSNHRLIADLRTWRQYTGHDYRNISIDSETLGLDSQREILCGNTSPGAPGARTQICLAIWGSTVNGVRTVHAGWYLPPRVEDVHGQRYGCFGSGLQGICSR
jgi:hypothetical protein